MGQSQPVQRAPTDDAKDSTYFNRHSQDNPQVRVEPHALLQSYGDLYVNYLGGVSDFFSEEKTLDINIPLYPPHLTSVGEQRGHTHRPSDPHVSASFSVKLKTSAVNKILNEVAKTGRLHTDHAIKACVTNVPIAPNMRIELFDRLKKKNAAPMPSSGAAVDSSSSGSTTTGDFVLPFEIPSVVIHMDQFVRGMGLIGTHVTTVTLTHADVEHLSLN